MSQHLIVQGAVPIPISIKLGKAFAEQDFADVQVTFEPSSLPFGAGTTLVFQSVDSDKRKKAFEWYKTEIEKLGYRTGLA